MKKSQKKKYADKEIDLFEISDAQKLSKFDNAGKHWRQTVMQNFRIFNKSAI